MSNLQRWAMIRTRLKTWLLRFGSRYHARQHRPTTFYGIWQRIANENSSCINISHFRSRSSRSSTQPPLSRAYLDKTSSIAQHRWNSTTIENAQSEMSCMHRFQSYTTQEAISKPSWYTIYLGTMARHLLGFRRQHANPIHQWISVLRHLRVRMVRC